MACCKKIYTVPTFPLSVGIWTGGMMGGPIGQRFITVGQLYYGELAANNNSPATFNFNFGKLSYLLLPVGTDVRTVICGPLVFNDYCEVPRTSGRFYQIMHVDDRWKGLDRKSVV